ncbi:hypothetical protein BSR28_06520 [Boudabousia liubingyangii]|uniref:hypothetical protein n=1 Tax=Boudabousia liubingyangii TaxID=1921764 RepID=UPI00093BB605|nr:hypothetical protein [Boudabousia liubingyangii]OKL47059.1 hypothetical protein BSR28_06520 [Boudabousia liubingyangii]
MTQQQEPVIYTPSTSKVSGSKTFLLVAVLAGIVAAFIPLYPDLDLTLFKIMTQAISADISMSWAWGIATGLLLYCLVIILLLVNFTSNSQILDFITGIVGIIGGAAIGYFNYTLLSQILEMRRLMGNTVFSGSSYAIANGMIFFTVTTVAVLLASLILIGAAIWKENRITANSQNQFM